MAAFAGFRFGDLFRSILHGSLTEAIVSAERFAERSLHSLVRYLVDWYKSLLIQVGAAAALGLVAAVSLGSAIAQGLVAMGMAPWLAHLVLSGAAGVGAFFLIQNAGAKFRAEAEPGPEETRGTKGILDLLLQILLSRSPEPPPKSPPARKRRRRRKVVDVHPRDDEWEVSQTGSRRKKRAYRTHARAVKAARAAARKTSAEVVIHGADGRIREVVAASEPTHGEDRPI